MRASGLNAGSGRLDAYGRVGFHDRVAEAGVEVVARPYENLWGGLKGYVGHEFGGRTYGGVLGSLSYRW